MTTDVASGAGWKLKAIGLLMGFGLALRWLAGHPELSDGLMARIFGALDWLVLTGLFAGTLLIGLRLCARVVAGLWHRLNPAQDCEGCPAGQDG
ncbi:hypothetical protein [Mesobacterium pallidum]|uniref:hypothetical protein n=1 Tax=Mesobacterium pallidum TaxID=2872037 RepID=UPI001EE1A092|nr:hypothetical protein [Mesobacterium pallidum]